MILVGVLFEQGRAMKQVKRKLRLVSISDLKLSGVNDLLYRPIDPGSDDIFQLAMSININGLLEPLIITRDGYIVSGHRRYTACMGLGIEKVKCEIIPINHDDPRFIAIIRECNRQRVKSLDEVMHELFIDAAGKVDVDALVDERVRAATVHIPGITLHGSKTRARISENKYPFLTCVIDILNHNTDFWPLSDRQIHYQLLNNPPLIHAKKSDSVYRNDRKSYQSLCDLLTRARLEGHIPWDVISDPTRPIVSWNVFPDVAPFIKGELDSFLSGYYRNYQQSQPCHIEIIGEKNTIESTIRPIAMKYCIPYTIGRGYCSIQPRYELVQRFKKSGKEKLVLLILSDLDPDGNEIAESFAKSIRDDFGVSNLHAVKVALTKEQVDELQLPPMMQAKKSSSKYDKFVNAHGKNVYELEAIRPKKLQAYLEDTIRSVIDVDRFNVEVDLEERERVQLRAHKERMIKRCKDD